MSFGSSRFLNPAYIEQSLSMLDNKINTIQRDIQAIQGIACGLNNLIQTTHTDFRNGLEKHEHGLREVAGMIKSFETALSKKQSSNNIENLKQESWSELMQNEQQNQNQWHKTEDQRTQQLNRNGRFEE